MLVAKRDGQSPLAEAGLRAMNWRLCEATTNFVFVRSG
jgi:hypothetical protein